MTLPSTHRQSRPKLVESLEPRTLLSTSTHLTIVPTFASSITRDPRAASIEAAINAGIKVYETDFSNPITVRILFTEGGGLGSSETNYDTVSYSSYRAALVSHAAGSSDALAIATLPAGSKNPVNGGSYIDLTNPNARALGFATSGGYDSTITLNPSICNLTRTSVAANKYDLQAVAMHEMDEVLGTGSELDGSNNGDPPPTGAVEPDDLFRYASAGKRSFSTGVNTASYYSINGGKTMLARFNQDEDGDFGDWYSVNGGNIPQVQDAFGTPGVIDTFNVELTRLDVLGYTPTFPVGTGIISGVVFNDVNGNGVKDSTEKTNLSGWTIEAVQNGKVITTATSNVLGYQLTGLASGTYTIIELPMTGYRQSTPATSFTVTVSGQQTVTGKNFGDTTKPLLTGTIFNDVKGTGLRVSTDPLLAGWVVDAIAGGKVVAAATTNSLGVYSFTVLSAGTKYTISEVVKTGYKETYPTLKTYTVTPTAGQIITKLDFGDHFG